MSNTLSTSMQTPTPASAAAAAPPTVPSTAPPAVPPAVPPAAPPSVPPTALPPTPPPSEDTPAARCSVCLVGMDDDTNIVTTPCEHRFHTHCFFAWIKNKVNCPICRASFTTTRQLMPSSDVMGELRIITRLRRNRRRLHTEIEHLEDKKAYLQYRINGAIGELDKVRSDLADACVIRSNSRRALRVTPAYRRDWEELRRPAHRSRASRGIFESSRDVVDVMDYLQMS